MPRNSDRSGAERRTRPKNGDGIYTFVAIRGRYFNFFDLSLAVCFSFIYFHGMQIANTITRNNNWWWRTL